MSKNSLIIIGSLEKQLKEEKDKRIKLEEELENIKKLSE